jgi:hypothetical protein
MSASPHTTGERGRDLDLPDFRDYAVEVDGVRTFDRARPRACSASSCAT